MSGIIVRCVLCLCLCVLSVSSTDVSLGGIVGLANAGYFDKFADELRVVTVQRYPNNNCGTGIPRTAQDIYGDYLSHR